MLQIPTHPVKSTALPIRNEGDISIKLFIHLKNILVKKTNSHCIIFAPELLADSLTTCMTIRRQLESIFILCQQRILIPRPYKSCLYFLHPDPHFLAERWEMLLMLGWCQEGSVGDTHSHPSWWGIMTLHWRDLKSLQAPLSKLRDTAKILLAKNLRKKFMKSKKLTGKKTIVHMFNYFN